MPRVTSLLLLPVLLPLATPAFGQAPHAIDVPGQVLDSSTGAGVPLAQVVVTDLAIQTFADSVGSFHLSLPPGKHHFEITRIGYTGIAGEIDVEKGTGLRVGLMPQPTILEGITVTADRLARARSLATASVDWAGSAELKASTENNLLDFMQHDLLLVLAECDSGRHEGTCARVYGKVMAPTIIVDGRCFSGGLSMLTMYSPADLYAVEVYKGGRLVAVYTDFYMEQVARGTRMLHTWPFLECTTGML